MIAQMQSPKPLTDLEWILKVTKSATSLEQLHSSFNCFILWDKKYSNSLFPSEIKNQISNKKAQFWSIFKTMECKFSTPDISKK